MRKCYLLIDETLPCAECVIGVYSSKNKADKALNLAIEITDDKENYRIVTEIIL